MCISNSCFLTCIQISQEAGQVVWYSHLFQNFPQFIVIHKVKGFGIVNRAERDAFMEVSCFSMIQWMLVIWSLVPLPFLKPAWTMSEINQGQIWKPHGLVHSRERWWECCEAARRVHQSAFMSLYFKLCQDTFSPLRHTFKFNIVETKISSYPKHQVF